MKKFKLFGVIIALIMVLTVTACVKKDNYKDYIGYAFDGIDPWGNTLSINLKELKDDELTWTYNVIIGEEKYSITLSDEFTNELKDNVIKFKVKGTALDNDNYTYDYSGTITLKDKKLIVKYDKGQLNEKSDEGGSASYQVEALNDSKKTVTLKKAESK